VGPHGERHLLYAPWEGDIEKSLVSVDSLRRDIADNMKELSDAGVDLPEVSWFMPSYEHFNTETVRVAASMGLELLHLTPGILTRADYTTPDMPSYRSSRDLLKQLYEFEKKNGLYGAVLLIHPGTEPARTDKLYDNLDGMIRRLERKGYVFERLP
jgi:peptidoglycan/xylan/chitin deacetylase (PgdA/CDA1 family)